uniref:Nuclear receptor subfamily 0, group B, member 2b n=1 Tax=Amphiprion ocellaris TaxID=80972 RepID=A0A3Q1BQ72_AMPOC
MCPLEKNTNNFCPRYHEEHTILYNILSFRDSGYHNNKVNFKAAAHNCHCEQKRRFASNVLVKTICFMRCSPSFSQLPPRDWSSLLRHCWVPVFVLGLAQEKIVFKVTDVPSSNILHQILLRPVLTNKEAEQPTLAGVHRLQICLRQLWNLDLSPKEYAYLKGAMLFNPAVQGLSASSFIEGLQQEAERALQEVIHLLHPEDSSRFSRTLRAASAVQTVSHSLVTELFFNNTAHLLRK